MFRKRMGFLLSLLCMVLFAIPAFAKDSTSTITNISIKVDQNLSKLEAVSSLGNISESDFSTGNTDRYHVDAVQWVESGNFDVLRVGSEPKVLLYLVADSKEKNNGDVINYQFAGAYSSSNVRVSS